MVPTMPMCFLQSSGAKTNMKPAIAASSRAVMSVIPNSQNIAAVR